MSSQCVESSSEYEEDSYLKKVDYDFLFDWETITEEAAINKLKRTNYNQAQLREIAGRFAHHVPGVTKYIVSRGVNTNATHDKRFKEPLFHRIVSSGNLKLIELALQKGANINYQGESRRLPIQAIMGQLDTDGRSKSGSTELEVIEFLLKHGADPTCGEDDPIYMYAMPYYSHTYDGRAGDDVRKYAKLLNKYGYNVNADNYKNVPEKLDAAYRY